jgi:dienelactone hydrolase
MEKDCFSGHTKRYNRGNGACAGWGGWFSNFLTEISSHGFYIVANGGPSATSILSFTKGTDLPDAVDWVHKVAGTGEFTNMDKDRIAVAGQSCGGIQAYTASLDPRIKVTGIFNSGLINEANKKYFPKLHAPVGYFLGGPTDIAYVNVSSECILELQFD